MGIMFPPAAKSATYRLREIANQFCEQGWDVTVLNQSQDSFLLDQGLDQSLMAGVHDRVSIIELPLFRQDLETDIRQFSEARALDPNGWNKGLRARSLKAFPEPFYGSWKQKLFGAAVEVHRRHPIDLTLASCVPYVQAGVAHELHRKHGVPFAIDYRDGWSINVVTGQQTFQPTSRNGKIEAAILCSAEVLWVVNEPIAEHYRQRFPQLAAKVRVVRNGFDPESQPPLPLDPPDGPLVFGYLGVANFSDSVLADVLEAWGLARAESPLLSDARLEFRGRFGAGAARHTTGKNRLLSNASTDGVSFGGPVDRRDVAAVYARWHALLLILIGGRFATSGKVYEYMATGLPIVSNHALDHGAVPLLAKYPLWAGNGDLEVDQLVATFVETANLVRNANWAERIAARGYAETYRRSALMAPAVSDLAASVLGRAGVAP